MPPLRDLITDPGLDLTPSERKVVRALLDQYPRNGLGPMARLAEHAGVSDPTIVRLVKKLGFGGYADFQEALLSDMDHRLRSPRTLLQPRSQQNKNDAWAHYLADSHRLLVDTQALTQPEDVRILVEWLLDSRHQIYCFGGRFSILLANYLLNHLRLLRPGCFALEDNALLPDRLYDLQRQDVVLVFDYRRYQTQALRVATAAKNNNARVVLFTDVYASPLREMADLIISAPVESASPFDTMVPALAQVEALIACLTLRVPDPADRLEGIDALRNDFATHLLEEK
ncbi:RpiR family transcriptional regulator [Pseudomonas moraviensis]|jgi:DNA-binding MurR/RpiR family transcriptional regulator|uniref:RpiR family transcriptional regulator n=2 Tax=Pseudomonas fluorescens group TaxID=136843 RepID=A0A423NRK4_9PSED|nr:MULTISPECIES: MurR/RpiR family transcriptional regulator [Pseudomonas]KIP91320.1 RpiR family transcriptional regulator [Pseudomonas fluorescens]KPG85213.1 RpiR family transcriptional regulator [Pseudomonas sp. RIT-PI-o]MDR6162763.1 DNA-binding MurR/RpiR family transcriptional regulator [Pseudomonas fluorescens]PWB29279.1 MurR/RpiR family transcriptional regulator [Pseudomonas sp. NDM]ROO00889.1 RpiR family transcriptional regulator [Pseudomonas moraviensis]